MIRHMLLFSFREDVAEGERQALLDELRGFPAAFPQMRSFELGSNRSRRDTAYTHGMTVAFDAFDALHAYLDSAEHERFVAERFRPLVSSRAIVSFET